jgi:RNA polymerase sigma factor (sigma-70 family)
LRDAQLEAIDDLVDVERAVTRLTQRQREVLALTVAGWTQEEIGAELGVTHQVVSEHLAKARGALAGCLQNGAENRCSSQGRE